MNTFPLADLISVAKGDKPGDLLFKKRQGSKCLYW